MANTDSRRELASARDRRGFTIRRGDYARRAGDDAAAVYRVDNIRAGGQGGPLLTTNHPEYGPTAIGRAPQCVRVDLADVPLPQRTADVERSTAELERLERLADRGRELTAEFLERLNAGTGFTTPAPLASPATPRGRGGARPGAGRKPRLESGEVRSFTLDARTLARIAEWQADPANRARSASEAVRQMVDLAYRRRAAILQQSARKRAAARA